MVSLGESRQRIILPVALGCIFVIYLQMTHWYLHGGGGEDSYNGEAS